MKISFRASLGLKRSAALLLLPWLGACSSAPSSPPPSPVAARTSATAPAVPAAASADPKSPFRALKKGLTAAEVRFLLGAPAEIKRVESAGITSEIWTYRTSVPGPARQVAAEMQDVPFVDPVTGIMRMIKEPIYKLEQTRINETTDLLMIKGLLVEWKQLRTAERTFQ